MVESRRFIILGKLGGLALAQHKNDCMPHQWFSRCPFLEMFLVLLVFLAAAFAQSCTPVHDPLEAQSMSALGLICGYQGVSCTFVAGDCHFTTLDAELLVDEESVTNLTFPFLSSSKGLKILQAVQLTYFDMPVYNSTLGYPLVISGGQISTMTLPSLISAGSVTLNSPQMQSLSLPVLQLLQAFDNGDAFIDVSSCTALTSLSVPNLGSIISSNGDASITVSESSHWDPIFPGLTTMKSGSSMPRLDVQGQPSNVRFPLLQSDCYVSLTVDGCVSMPYIGINSTGSINGNPPSDSYANIPPNSEIGLGPDVSRQTC